MSRLIPALTSAWFAAMAAGTITITLSGEPGLRGLAFLYAVGPVSIVALGCIALFFSPAVLVLQRLHWLHSYSVVLVGVATGVALSAFVSDQPQFASYFLPLLALFGAVAGLAFWEVWIARLPATKA